MQLQLILSLRVWTRAAAFLNGWWNISKGLGGYGFVTLLWPCTSCLTLFAFKNIERQFKSWNSPVVSLKQRCHDSTNMCYVPYLITSHFCGTLMITWQMRGGTECVIRDISVHGQGLAVIVLRLMPLSLSSSGNSSPPAPVSSEGYRSTQGSHPGSLHYLWPVVKHTPTLLYLG